MFYLFYRRLIIVTDNKRGKVPPGAIESFLLESQWSCTLLQCNMYCTTTDLQRYILPLVGIEVTDLNSNCQFVNEHHV